jgi:hypothetical protein
MRYSGSFENRNVSIDEILPSLKWIPVIHQSPGGRSGSPFSAPIRTSRKDIRRNIMNQSAVCKVLCIGMVALLAIPTHAQWTNPYWGGTFNNPTSSLLQTQILGRARLEALQKELSSKPAQSTSRPTAAQSTAAQLTVVSFRPDPKASMVATLANTFGSNDEERTQLQTFFTQGVQAYETQAKQSKQPHNVARAVAFFIALNWSIAQQKEVEEAAFNNLTRRMQGFFARGDAGKMTNAQKQKLYETLVMLALLANAGVNDAVEKKDSDQAKTFRTMAKNNVETLLGVPIGRMKFTQSTFIVEK